jgi:antitoxin ParD1/3/4/toxin ParE1/3/4
MKAFILSPEAERDLDVIKTYLIERGGVRVARYVMRELRNGIRFLATNPAAGHVRGDLTGERVKFWAIYSYLIVYDPAKQPIEIVRVLHGRRNVERILN